MTDSSAAPTEVGDVTCPVCSCLCDDLRVTLDNARIVRAEGSCSLSRDWFLNSSRTVPASTIEGRPVSLDDAISRAAQILSAARSPLIYGLSRATIEAQRAAVALADKLGATIDTTASICHGHSIMAIQQVGESTCSLGEVKNRSDLVIFWGADPVTTHPRHFERYAVDATGLHIPHGRSDRTVYVVDTQPTATSEQADHFLQIEPGRDYDVLTALRLLLKEDRPRPGTDCGAPLDQLQTLVERMKACRYGAVFFGLELARRTLGHQNVEALLLLVAELNAHTRFVARRMRIAGNVAGADSVLTWQTGYPFAVNLGRGYPRYNPGEFTANEVLERGEVDACLFVGTETVPDFSPTAKKALDAMPTVGLDSPHVERPLSTTVAMTTAINGIQSAGTMYRMDEIPVPVKGFVDTAFPTDADVLRRLLAALSSVRHL